jgi:hypothetical protein
MSSVVGVKRVPRGAKEVGSFVGSSGSTWNNVTWLLGSNVIGVAIGIAVMRYRLYDLDRVVSRTLSYAILTGVLVGVYIGVVSLATGVLPLSSSVGVAASTLVAAALFNPLRKRLQHVVDRRFNRAHYDAQAVVAAFSERLGTALELGGIEDDLFTTVSSALGPTTVGVWLCPERALAHEAGLVSPGGRKGRER